MKVSARKTRPDVGASERATETGTDCRTASTSDINSTTPATGCLQISNLLLRGAKNALSRRYLEEITGLDGRTVRALIAKERLRGTPILSDCQHGYFLPADEREKARFVQSMRRRAAEIVRAAEAVERTKG